VNGRRETLEKFESLLGWHVRGAKCEGDLLPQDVDYAQYAPQPFFIETVEKDVPSIQCWERLFFEECPDLARYTSLSFADGNCLRLVTMS
jgi:hypothetical protein